MTSGVPINIQKESFAVKFKRLMGMKDHEIQLILPTESIKADQPLEDSKMTNETIHDDLDEECKPDYQKCKIKMHGHTDLHGYITCKHEMPEYKMEVLRFPCITSRDDFAVAIESLPVGVEFIKAINFGFGGWAVVVKKPV